MMNSVSTFVIYCLRDRKELTLRTTCVSSKDAGPRIFVPLDWSGNSSFSPVYTGLGRALASDAARDVITSKAK